MKKLKDFTKLDWLLVTTGVIYLVFEILGDVVFDWMKNYQCFALLGCNAGFFGYDALLHYFSGVFEVSALAWLMNRYDKIDLRHREFWKSAVILIVCLAFIVVAWEMLEFANDHIRTIIFHVNLLHPNNLTQVGNSDTMGDMTFALLGGLTSIGLLKVIKGLASRD